ncbi:MULTISPECIES: response regulator transcription factor [Variovorax]|jgi:DNA-binding response OmpR family regulator|uniref:response regulator transcription factor n=1 Tax=Variovorax TaxID=34072 RepID=UPI00086F8701|nr:MULTISPECIES: response regulator transcription factor [Variovorax]MBN8754107.1 response regulator transcription factor [Variovorax sp.]ODU18416.1 MAG: DNA-binding response regulator [Variovorax sp. SCN 67-85]ODV25150.1 MAG: DNA-binding response regulator [Variovorax sp. SCN 67-20]OJZ04902.1 MAG: DNA-binding response regulator [Variovorax sp. 67-131]UKI09189.1 response regulator transcription factor [Variovorax paradoxus]
MRIAVLDDGPDQRRLINQTMVALGHECHTFTAGRTLLQSLRRQTFDLLILDWHLPDMAGPDVVKTIRLELKSRLPILFVTDRRDEDDMVEGLNAGADDFMARPIRAGELEARVNALFRRSYPGRQEAEMVFGPYHFYPPSRTLKVRGTPVELKNREYELALFLFQNLGRLLSREHLHEAVWGLGIEALSRSLDTHVSRLRTKLDLRPANGFLLLAIYGLGYRLETIDENTMLKVGNMR